MGCCSTRFYCGQIFQAQKGLDWLHSIVSESHYETINFLFQNVLEVLRHLFEANYYFFKLAIEFFNFFVITLLSICTHKVVWQFFQFNRVAGLRIDYKYCTIGKITLHLIFRTNINIVQKFAQLGSKSIGLDSKFEKRRQKKTSSFWRKQVKIRTKKETTSTRFISRRI